MEMVLRWMIGIGATLGLGVFALILVVGKGLASTFRAGSESSDLTGSVLGIGIPLMLSFMIASVCRPEWKVVQHAVACMAAAALFASLAVLKTNPGEGWIYIGFLSLWFAYHAMRLMS